MEIYDSQCFGLMFVVRIISKDKTTLSIIMPRSKYTLLRFIHCMVSPRFETCFLKCC